MSPPKRRLPGWILWTSAGLALVAVAWACAVLYTEGAVARDLDSFRAAYQEPAGADSDPNQAMRRFVTDMIATDQVLRQGCRVLPALMRELRPDSPGEYASRLTSAITILVRKSHAFDAGAPQAKELQTLMDGMKIEPTDPPQVRGTKVEALHAWWKENGSAYHQWWRFWSTACRAPLSKDF